MIAAAEVFDLVELDADLDLTRDILDRVPVERRVIVWRRVSARLSVLRRNLEESSQIGAHSHVLEVEASSLRERMIPLEFLGTVRREDVAAYAVGQDGIWTRVLSSRIGSPLILVHLGRRKANPI